MTWFHRVKYYAWLYEGSQLYVQLAGFGMVAIILAAVMFPLWPAFLRQGVWYLSIAVLFLIGAFIVLAIIRLIFYLITVVVTSPGIWIFPNLFEDVGFVDSFKPLWGWDLPPPPKKKRSSKAKEAIGEGDAASSGAQPDKEATEGNEDKPASGRTAVANLPGVTQTQPQMRGANIAKAATPTPAAQVEKKEYLKLDELD